MRKIEAHRRAEAQKIGLAGGFHINLLGKKDQGVVEWWRRLRIRLTKEGKEGRERIGVELPHYFHYNSPFSRPT